MLSNQQRAIVKATVPALRAHGETITRRFYDAMLSAHPELNNYFNPANQLGEGGQARALAASVLSYAQNIDRLETLDGMVGRIAERHFSLEIRPDHYPIVGEYLLRAIADVLKDAATPDILDAWAAAYGQLANVMIGREAALRKVAREQPGGWVGFKGFRVVHKVRESQVMTSFILEPEDGKPLPQFMPGQYVSIKVRPPGVAFDQTVQPLSDPEWPSVPDQCHAGRRTGRVLGHPTGYGVQFPSSQRARGRCGASAYARGRQRAR